ncbi:MAG: HAD hydrolase-like protein [Candidatus Micrarchaeia archaeon]
MGFKGIKAVIFDVDGVLVDTRRSYRKAVIESVRWFLKKQGMAERPRMRLADIAEFKSIRGFNSDWDIAYALALFYLVRQRGKKLGLAGWCRRIEREGGGVGGARKVLEGLGKAREIAAVWSDRNELSNPIYRFFQERYLGGKRFEDVYGEKAAYWKGRGLIESERLLVKADRLKRLARLYALALVTGRPKYDLEFAVEKWGLRKIFPVRVAMEDTRSAKPHPEPILLALRLLGRSAGETLYVGDGVDDALAARAAGVRFAGVRFAGAGRALGKSAFRSTAELVRRLAKVKKAR